MVVTLFADIMFVPAGDMALFSFFAVTAQDVNRVFMVKECFTTDHAVFCLAVILEIYILSFFFVVFLGLP